jgi:hypothetical protein
MDLQICTSGGIKRCASLFVASTISIGASSFEFGSVKSNLFHKKNKLAKDYF